MATKLKIHPTKVVDLEKKEKTHRRNGIALEVPLKRGRPKGALSKVHKVAEEEVAVVKRGRGRPRKETTTVMATMPSRKTKEVRVTKEVPVLKRRQKRITNEQLLMAETSSGHVPLAANRMIEQIDAMLSRTEVQAFRGRKERPKLILSMLEDQMLRELKILLELKVTMQRGGQLRRSRVG